MNCGIRSSVDPVLSGQLGLVDSHPPTRLPKGAVLAFQVNGGFRFTMDYGDHKSYFSLFLQEMHDVSFLLQGVFDVADVLLQEGLIPASRYFMLYLLEFAWMQRGAFGSKFRCREMEMLSVSAFDMKFGGLCPGLECFMYVWITVIDFSIQVVKTLVSQRICKECSLQCRLLSASRGLVCYRRAGISVFDYLEFAWFQRCFFGSKF